MNDPAMDRGGLKDSENAPNSFFSKINRTVFWRFGTDMTLKENEVGHDTDIPSYLYLRGSV